MCFIVLYFHGHAFFCWELSKSALLCFIFGKMCFFFVNKSIRYKLNDIKQEKGLPKLVMCPPSCLIHVCHNSFRKGLAQFGQNAEELCLNLYYFFKKSPCRNELVVLCTKLMVVSCPSFAESSHCEGSLEEVIVRRNAKKGQKHREK